MEEIWKHIRIDGQLSKYKISNYGQIKSFKYGKPRILKVKSNIKGYKQLRLTNENGKPAYVSIHRLVAEYFLDGFNSSLEIHHKDYNKENNRVDNLEAITTAQKIEYSKNFLCINQVKTVRLMCDNSVRQEIIANKLNISVSTVSNIKNNKYYKWVE
jgi:hypothetical protein